MPAAAKRHDDRPGAGPVLSCVPVDKTARPGLYITEQLGKRVGSHPDFAGQSAAIQALAQCMADRPEEVLPKLVELAMRLAEGTSAGLSLLEPEPAPGVFRWRWLHGELARFENAIVPRDDSPCGVTLDRRAPVLVAHPETAYAWIAAERLTPPEVLLVPLYVGGEAPAGTLWIIAPKEGHFHREHARLAAELAHFAGIALKMLHQQDGLRAELAAARGGASTSRG